MKIDWIDVKYSNQGQQEHAYIFCINLKFFQKLICFMNQSPFITILALLFNLYKSHFFENFIK